LFLRAIAGNIRFAGRHVDLQKLPLLETATRAVTTYDDPGDFGQIVSMSYDKDAEIAGLFQKLIRRALAGIRADQRSVFRTANRVRPHLPKTTVFSPRRVRITARQARTERANCPFDEID